MSYGSVSVGIHSRGFSSEGGAACPLQWADLTPWPRKTQTRSRDGQRACTEANAAQAAFAVLVDGLVATEICITGFWLSVVGEIDVAILNTCYGW